MKMTTSMPGGAPRATSCERHDAGVVPLLESGVNILGGCCGSSPNGSWAGGVIVSTVTA